MWEIIHFSVSQPSIYYCQKSANPFIFVGFQWDFCFVSTWNVPFTLDLPMLFCLPIISICPFPLLQKKKSFFPFYFSLKCRSILWVVPLENDMSKYMSEISKYFVSSILKWAILEDIRNSFCLLILSSDFFSVKILPSFNFKTYLLKKGTNLYLLKK